MQKTIFTREFWRTQLSILRALIWKHVLWSVLFSVSFTWVLTSALVYQAERGVSGSNINSFGEALWWGIVTLLTVGYGDKYPITTEGRIVASVLMVTGVACVGVITAKISSIFLERALRDGRGFVVSNQLKNHFIICGWNENMGDLLLHILDFNPDLTSNHLVIIANSTQSTQDSLLVQPRLKDLHFIIGDHFSEMNLRRAAPERAQKILILADRTPSPTGQLPTPTETDARTIMTAMTISNIARGTLVTAEILDPKMDHYLKLANVSEIIYSSEYSRLLLGNATGGTGIANIVFDLLDNRAGAHITSHPLPPESFSQTYVSAKASIEARNPHLLVIGVLENSGNSHSIKELALRRAQQTPDMAQLVLNLQSVRDLRCNNPVFHPADDYKICEGSMAIVISKKNQKRKGSENGAAFAQAKTHAA